MGSGEPVLIGGRYDNLLDSFEAPDPAIGFGINVDALARVMLKRGNIPQNKKVEILVHALPGYEMEAIRYTNTLTHANMTGENSVFETEEDALAYARSRGIRMIAVVGSEIKTRDTGV